MNSTQMQMARRPGLRVPAILGTTAVLGGFVYFLYRNYSRSVNPEFDLPRDTHLEVSPSGFCMPRFGTAAFCARALQLSTTVLLCCVTVCCIPDSGDRSERCWVYFAHLRSIIKHGVRARHPCDLFPAFLRGFNMQSSKVVRS